MKTIFILFIAGLSLTSCISTSNLYQDGKTLGKDSLDGAFSVTLHQMPRYFHLDTDTAAKNQLHIGDQHDLAPWVQLHGQYGITKRLDIGGSAGTGIMFGGGAQIFAKYAMLPKESRTGIALLALGGFAYTDLDNEEDDDDEPTAAIGYLNSLYAMPISFDVSKRVSLVVQPIYGIERVTLRFKDDDPSTPRRISRTFTSYKLGAGIIVKSKKGTKIHYNVTTAYYPETEAVVASFGIAFIPKR